MVFLLLPICFYIIIFSIYKYATINRAKSIIWVYMIKIIKKL